MIAKWGLKGRDKEEIGKEIEEVQGIRPYFSVLIIPFYPTLFAVKLQEMHLIKGGMTQTKK